MGSSPAKIDHSEKYVDRHRRSYHQYSKKKMSILQTPDMKLRRPSATASTAVYFPTEFKALPESAASTQPIPLISSLPTPRTTSPTPASTSPSLANSPLPVAQDSTLANLSVPAVQDSIDDNNDDDGDDDDDEGYFSDINETCAVYVYTDIITTRKVGYQENRLLRVIPLQSKKSSFIEFTHIEYIPLITNHINSISISIHDDQGQRIAFCPSRSPIICTLHFRKIRNI